MPARFIEIGPPAHDAERQALRFLVEGLSEDFTVYGNAWLVDRAGPVYEVDAVVVAPHAFFVVECKSYRGRIEGNDHDWRIPQPIRSPLKLNRKTAQILASCLKFKSHDAARPFVEGLVFLSHASQCTVNGPASKGRVHTKQTILNALQDPSALWSREPRRAAVDEHARAVLAEILTQVDPSLRPPRLIREWKLEAPVERTERYAEYFATHTITAEPAVLRVYDVSPLADDATRKRLEELFRWEAQVLRRIGEEPCVLHAHAPFSDEAGYVVPFEAFPGLTLTTWIERHAAALGGNAGIAKRVELWARIARAVQAAHAQGVIHRILHPDVVLIADTIDAPEIRVAGFELAKQLHLRGRETVAISTLADDRRRFSAPEVVRSFTEADARSDQFSLGVLLSCLVVGKPPFDSTEELLRRSGAFTRLRDVNPNLKITLDQAFAKMLERAAANRFPSLDEAIDAVLATVQSKPASVEAPRLDPENLAPGTRLGTDYEIIDKLGAGGMATVYAARHLVSGTSRALKVAREDARAEETLVAEHNLLEGINHPNIVAKVDIRNDLVAGRRTLILNRVKGASLAKRLTQGPIPDQERRQWAENLLAALGYLEQQEIVHKDLKPDNLVVGPEGLTLIDFSLAGEPADATMVGTALYRDPALARWSPVADRYAAALCLFELYVGRHAFGGQAPAPGDEPRVDPSEVDRPALGDLFRKALHPIPAQRYPSASAFRAALVDALGGKLTVSEPPGSVRLPASSADKAPLSATSLSGTALATLRRAGISTQGALVSLTDGQIQSLPGLGNRKREEVLSMRRMLVESGVRAGARAPERQPLAATLSGDETSIHGLPALTQGLATSLERAGFTTIGRVADATRDELRELSGMGSKTIAQIVQALHAFEAHAQKPETPQSLDAFWELATRPLSDLQRGVLERLFGFEGPPLSQNDIADALDTNQTNISVQKQHGMRALDRRVLDELIDHLESALISAGGVLRFNEAASRLCERFPTADDFGTDGLLRLIADLEPSRIRSYALLDEDPTEVLVRPNIRAEDLRAFLDAAVLAAERPWRSAEAVRQTLLGYLEYQLDLVGLALRLDSSLRLTQDGELFQSPVDTKEAMVHVLNRARLPITVSDLAARLRDHFGEALIQPPDDAIVRELVATRSSYHIDPATSEIQLTATRSIVPTIAPSDPIQFEDAAKDPLDLARDLLRAARQRDGCRLVVAPPACHGAVARSVGRALEGATFVSFEDAFFARAGDAVEGLERAERFAAQRPKLKREAEATFEAILAEHGKSGRAVVLGDTALFGVCDALHLVRTLYDRTVPGGKGFWALVIPGTLSNKQPLFNERPNAQVFSIEGSVVRLPRELH